MREQRQIVARWHQGSGSILVTLLRVQGSSYRQPGARLLVCKDGSYEGSISAGCLEASLLRKAAWLIRNGAAIERYSTLFDETTEMPFGLGCGGILDLLLEPVETEECSALLQATEAALRGEERIIATWPPSSRSTLMRAVFNSNGELVFSSQGLSQVQLEEARSMGIYGETISVTDMAIERLMPPQRLFIFGAGDDAKPLVTMACLLGWHVTVVDGRSRLARKSRFRENDAEVEGRPEVAIARINACDAVVIMSHSYEQDRQYLTSLLPHRPRYIGLLGSRQRSALLIAEAARELHTSIAECCALICAPVGMDIGGEGPEVIALAILAEAQARCAGKGASSRGLSPAHVHHYLATSEVSRFMRTECGADA